jgi:4-oxalocrotonate tautomerase
MPFITVKVLEGKTTEQKRELVKKMTDVVSDTFEVDADKVFIFFEDLEKDNYGKQGELYSFIENKPNK